MSCRSVFSQSFTESLRFKCERSEYMTKSYVDRIAITIRLIHLPTMGCGIVMLMFLVFVGVGSLAHAEEQSVKISNSTDMIGKLVKNSEGRI